MYFVYMTISESERNHLREKINRDSLTIGVSIPEELTVQGQTIPLQTLIFEICSSEDVPDHLNDNISSIKRDLIREMSDCIQTIENEEITYNTGQELVTKVAQIQRAINIVENPTENHDISTHAQRSQAKDTKKWRDFVDRITE